MGALSFPTPIPPLRAKTIEGWTLLGAAEGWMAAAHARDNASIAALAETTPPFFDNSCTDVVQPRLTRAVGVAIARLTPTARTIRIVVTKTRRRPKTDLPTPLIAAHTIG